MTEETSPEATETDETPDAGVITPDDTETPTEGDTFPREYVEQLRTESKGHRERAKAAEDRADDYAKRLHTELVRADGRLHNPADLPFHDDHLTDPDALTAAIDAVILDRPYLENRTPKGDVGQGERGPADAPFSLLSRLQQSV